MFMKKIDLFQTTDFSLISFLTAAGFPIEKTEKDSSSRRVLFFFKQTAELDDLVQAFWRRETTVEPQAYFQATRLIKSRIYGG